MMLSLNCGTLFLLVELEIFLVVSYLILQLDPFLSVPLVVSVVVVVVLVAAAAVPVCRSKQKSYSAVSALSAASVAAVVNLPDSNSRCSHFQNGPYLNVVHTQHSCKF